MSVILLSLHVECGFVQLYSGFVIDIASFVYLAGDAAVFVTSFSLLAGETQYFCPRK
jgi:hypothetical protein